MSLFAFLALQILPSTNINISYRPYRPHSYSSYKCMCVRCYHRVLHRRKSNLKLDWDGLNRRWSRPAWKDTLVSTVIDLPIKSNGLQHGSSSHCLYKSIIFRYELSCKSVFNTPIAPFTQSFQDCFHGIRGHCYCHKTQRRKAIRWSCLSIGPDHPLMLWYVQEDSVIIAQYHKVWTGFSSCIPFSHNIINTLLLLDLDMGRHPKTVPCGTWNWDIGFEYFGSSGLGPLLGVLCQSNIHMNAGTQVSQQSIVLLQ